MKPQSAKAKGRMAQQEVQKMILTLFPELEPDDVRSVSMGAQGEDLQLSPAARKLLPFNFEVKRRKKIAFCRWMDQANTHGKHKPACFFREDHGEWFACIKAKDLLALLRAYNVVERKPSPAAFRVAKAQLKQEEKASERRFLLQAKLDRELS